MATPPGRFVEFISKLLTDESFRFQALFQEVTTMTNFGLDASEIDAVQKLNTSRMITALLNDLEDWGADIGKLHGEVYGPTNVCPDAPIVAPQLAAMAMYAQGMILILENPATVSKDNPGPMVLKGLGYDTNLRVWFKACSDGTIVGPVTTSVTVAHDLYQHAAIVHPALSEGTWLIYGSNSEAADPDFVGETLKPGLVQAI
jgi:hypothetical protein